LVPRRGYPVTLSQGLSPTLRAMIDRPQANRDALKACVVLGGFFVVIALGAYVYTLDIRPLFPRDGTTLVVGRDFLNFWMYGRAAQLPAPGQWYDPQLYNGMLTALLGGGYPGQNWSYPPTMMLVMAPFGALGYLPALALWSALGLAIFATVIWRYIGDRRATAAALCSPAAVFGLISGQLAFVSTAMLVAAFTWLDRRPIPSGILIGLLTVKPHLGILLPIMLAASRRWKVFLVASVTAVAFAGVSIALFGIVPWINYVEMGLAVQNAVLADAGNIATPFYPTLFMNLRGIGIGYGPAMTAQIALALAAAASVVWAFRNRADADPRILMALFFACSVAALPYMLVYDTLPLCVAAMALLANGTLDSRGRLLARLVFWLPLLQIGLGTFSIPGPALIAPAFAFYLLHHLKNERSAPRTALQHA
jgi:hypothetical protein